MEAVASVSDFGTPGEGMRFTMATLGTTLGVVVVASAFVTTADMATLVGGEEIIAPGGKEVEASHFKAGLGTVTDAPVFDVESCELRALGFCMAGAAYDADAPLSVRGEVGFIGVAWLFGCLTGACVLGICRGEGTA